jgi:hypothetical protein
MNIPLFLNLTWSARTQKTLFMPCNNIRMFENVNQQLEAILSPVIRYKVTGTSLLFARI